MTLRWTAEPWINLFSPCAWCDAISGVSSQRHGFLCPPYVWCCTNGKSDKRQDVRRRRTAFGVAPRFLKNGGNISILRALTQRSTLRSSSKSYPNTPGHTLRQGAGKRHRSILSATSTCRVQTAAPLTFPTPLHLGEKKNNSSLPTAAWVHAGKTVPAVEKPFRWAREREQGAKGERKWWGQAYT